MRLNGVLMIYHQPSQKLLNTKKTLSLVDTPSTGYIVDKIRGLRAVQGLPYMIVLIIDWI
jgi:hypothetical protein